jgi:hypothetical protein
MRSKYSHVKLVLILALSLYTDERSNNTKLFYEEFLEIVRTK